MDFPADFTAVGRYAPLLTGGGRFIDAFFAFEGGGSFIIALPFEGGGRFIGPLNAAFDVLYCTASDSAPPHWLCGGGGLGRTRVKLSPGGPQPGLGGGEPGVGGGRPMLNMLLWGGGGGPFPIPFLNMSVWFNGASGRDGPMNPPGGGGGGLCICESIC